MRAGGAGRPRAAGTAGWRPGRRAERARCLTSPWCRWTGRAAATMTTSRGSVGWTTGSAPSGKTRTVRVRPTGAGAGTGGVYTGLRSARAAEPRANTSTCRTLLFLLHARSDRRVFSVRDSRAKSSSSHPPPSSSPEGRGRGLQTWPPGEAGQQAAWFRLVPNACPGRDQVQREPGFQLPRFL